MAATPIRAKRRTPDVTTNAGVALSSTLLGLMRIEYTIPGGTPPGVYPLTFTPAVNGGGGNFYDNVSVLDSNYLLPGLLVNGAIVVQSPEPGSVALILLGAIGLLALRLRRR